jgi:hypothetical protein
VRISKKTFNDWKTTSSSFEGHSYIRAERTYALAKILPVYTNDHRVTTSQSHVSDFPMRVYAHATVGLGIGPSKQHVPDILYVHMHTTHPSVDFNHSTVLGQRIAFMVIETSCKKMQQVMTAGRQRRDAIGASTKPPRRTSYLVNFHHAGARASCGRRATNVNACDRPGGCRGGGNSR